MLSQPKRTKLAPSFPALIQMFFTQYLVEQRALSPQTVAAYRDTFALFLAFAQKRLAKPSATMTMIDLTPELILAFLDHLEQERHNGIRSRNARLAALRSFLKFAGRHDVSSLHVVERALGVPMKRFEHPMLGYLSLEEMLAIIGTSDSTWLSQRDHLLLQLLYNTGARVSEIIGVRVSDVILGAAGCVHLHGKGRKQRSLPLWRTTVKEIRTWLKRNPQLASTSALVPNRDGETMTRDNVAKRLALAVKKAAKTNTALAKLHISPHTIRHTTAMHMLQSGSRIELIALWLGHENLTTSHHYVEADLTMKDRALARLQEPENKLPRYQAPDSLLEFLKRL